MSMPAPKPRLRPRYADIEALPDHVNGEILAGELVVSPRPAPKHALAASALGGLLIPAFHFGATGPGGWWVLHEPELSLDVDPDFDPVIPDLAGWLRSGMPALPTTPQFQLRPDWVCEVLSPSTARHDRAYKLPFYARAGIPHAWIVDPLARTLEVYRTGTGGRWLLDAVFTGYDEVRPDPFAAVPLPLHHLWPAPTASESTEGG